MNKINDGGPAFPYVSTHGTFGNKGMTLRDYFAIELAAAWLSTFPPDARHPVEAGLENAFSDAAFKLADAMMERREK